MALRLSSLLLAIILLPGGLLAFAPLMWADSTRQTVVPETLEANQSTLVAYFVVTPEEVDSDTTGELSSALDDFQWYISEVHASLLQHGVRLIAVSDSIIVIHEDDRRYRRFNLCGVDNHLVGYWLFKPGGTPKQLTGGVRVDDDLLEQASYYFPEWGSRKH